MKINLPDLDDKIVLTTDFIYQTHDTDELYLRANDIPVVGDELAKVIIPAGSILEFTKIEMNPHRHRMDIRFKIFDSPDSRLTKKGKVKPRLDLLLTELNALEYEMFTDDTN